MTQIKNADNRGFLIRIQITDWARSIYLRSKEKSLVLL